MAHFYSLMEKDNNLGDKAKLIFNDFVLLNIMYQ